MRLDNGVLEVLMNAKAKGKVKHIGFTGHTTPDAHLRMLERVGKEKNDVLETCQMPINLADPSHSSFILNVLPVLAQRNYGVLAMKTLAGGRFISRGANKAIVPELASAEDALHFVWSLPVSVLISGPETAAQYKETISYARSFKGMTEERRKELIAKVQPVSGPGIENFKVG
jgi:predicted aldo/keto reductase-like oxidoreductase